jgi:MFS family permease
MPAILASIGAVTADPGVVQRFYLLWFGMVIVGIAVALVPVRAVSVALACSLLGSFAGMVVGAADTGIEDVTYWSAILASGGLLLGGLVALAGVWRGGRHAAPAVLLAAAACILVAGWCVARWVRWALIETCIYPSGSLAKFCHVERITTLIGFDAASSQRSASSRRPDPIGLGSVRRRRWRPHRRYHPARRPGGCSRSTHRATEVLPASPVRPTVAGLGHPNLSALVRLRKGFSTLQPARGGGMDG